MKILITTGLGRSDIGGPFQYAHNLEREFKILGHKVRVAKYGSVESSIVGVWPKVIWADRILALDTFSVGLPSVLAAKIFGKKVTIRVGGDFLWSAYVNRTGEAITLPAFYRNMPKLNMKEKFIFFFTKFTTKRADFLAFNTEWQRSIWQSFYKIKEGRSGVVRNFIPEKRGDPQVRLAGNKNFIWAGRLIPEKNPRMLKKFDIDIVTGESHEKVLEKLKNSYAAVSLAFTDICPNFIIEAASFNKPFIMTRETGLNEILPKGGIFVDSLDESAVRGAIEALLDDNTYNKHVEDLKSNTAMHSWSDLAKEFLDIWKKT